MQLKFKKLRPSAVIPSYSQVGDAGLDLTTTSIERHPTFKDILIYSTGLSVEIPEGYVGYIFPRSSIYKKDLSLVNAVGVIDSSYRGEVLCMFRVAHIPNTRFVKESYYEVGDRVAQLIVMPYPKMEPVEVEELSLTERGDKGFGSTGR